MANRRGHFWRANALIILDLNLPKAGGHAILQKYARVEGSPPIVVFTSSSSPTDSDTALAAGAKEYVVKPTLLDEFIQSVQGILERWSDPSKYGPKKR